MRVKRNCKTCGAEFWAVKSNQFFCQRRCFKKDFYQRNKEKVKAAAKALPKYKCPVCHKISDLPFSPLKNEHLFNEWVCPFCGIPHMVIVVQQQKNSNFMVGFNMTAKFIVQSSIRSY